MVKKELKRILQTWFDHSFDICRYITRRGLDACFQFTEAHLPRRERLMHTENNFDIPK